MAYCHSVVGMLYLVIRRALLFHLVLEFHLVLAFLEDPSKQTLAAVQQIGTIGSICKENTISLAENIQFCILFNTIPLVR